MQAAYYSANNSIAIQPNPKHSAPKFIQRSSLQQNAFGMLLIVAM